MKNSKLYAASLILFFSFPFMICSVIGIDNNPTKNNNNIQELEPVPNDIKIPNEEAISKEVKNPKNPKEEDVFKNINALIEKIESSDDDSWKKPGETRKRVIIIKLEVVKKQIINEEFDESYDKTLKDIFPKLIGKWVLDTKLQKIFSIDCTTILSNIFALIKSGKDPQGPSKSK